MLKRLRIGEVLLIASVTMVTLSVHAQLSPRRYYNENVVEAKSDDDPKKAAAAESLDDSNTLTDRSSNVIESSPVTSNEISKFLSTYRLGSGDVITVKVFGEEDLSLEKVRLTDAGTVYYPVLGEMKVLGLTVGELEKLVTDGLRGRYLKNPRLSVQIVEYRPFYINGMVDRPGGYPFQPGLTVRKAASLAGGFKERASFSKIYVIRESDKSQTPKNVELNAAIFPGDTIVVEDSFF